MYSIVLNFLGKKNIQNSNQSVLKDNFLIGLADRKFDPNKNLWRITICWIDLNKYATSKYSM